MGIFDPITRKINQFKEEREYSRKEEEATRKSRHEARMRLAPKRAEMLEAADIAHEVREARKGKRKESGLKDTLANFSAGMLHDTGNYGYNPNFMLGGGAPKRRTHKKTKRSKRR